MADLVERLRHLGDIKRRYRLHPVDAATCREAVAEIERLRTSPLTTERREAIRNAVFRWTGCSEKLADQAAEAIAAG